MYIYYHIRQRKLAHIDNQDICRKKYLNVNPVAKAIVRKGRASPLYQSTTNTKQFITIMKVWFIAKLQYSVALL